MHWLQTLDTGLFHFINRSLVNPFFDWLMPILSGDGAVMRWFLLAVVIAFVTALFCGPRARLCALMLALVLLLGDSLVVNTVKHAVARPRPFVTLPDARVFGVVGKGYVPPEAMAANTNGLQQHAVRARGQLVRRHDGPVSVLPEKLAVHAADGAGGFFFARLQRRALSQRRPGRRNSGRGLRRRRCRRVAGRVELDGAKMVPALARKNAVAAESSPQSKARSPKSGFGGWN